MTGDIWLTLDALRERDPYSFSAFLDDRSPSDTVLHELAHAYTQSFPQGSDLLDLFGQHYAGCSSRGLDTDRLITELLADTMVMAVTRAGSSLPSDYGYFGSGGFSGCLVESSQPDIALFRAVYSTLFNCASEHALDVFENHRNPLHTGLLFGNDADDDAVLLTCYGIDCITPTRGCQNLTETEARRDAAHKRLHERRCSDGLVGHAYQVFEEPGWEVGCEAFVPDDVECLVYRYRADEPDIPWRDDVNPGLLDVSGECIKPDCTVEGPQGEPHPGYREHSGFGDCIAIDRAERHSDSLVSPEPAQPEFVADADISPEASDGTDLSALTFDLFGGGTGTLAGYEGTPLVVNFFASWCPPCIREMPEFQEVFERLDGQVAFLGLSQDQSPQDALDLGQATGVTYDVGWDLDLEVYSATGSIAMPTTVFVSSSGELLDTFAGALDTDSLTKLIEDAFGTAASS